MDSFVDASDDRSPEIPAGDAGGRVTPADQPYAEPVREDSATDPRRLERSGLSRRQKFVFIGTIAFICAALIALIWVATNRAIRDQRAETEARARTWVQTQANLLTEAARRELATIDQSLVLVQSAWDADPDKFSLAHWQASIPGLADVVGEYFIANNKDVIVQDTLPQAVGQGIGGAYASVDQGKLEQITPNGGVRRDAQMVLGEVHDNGVVRRYLMYLVRSLKSRPGWLVGASYRSSALVKVFAEGGLGTRGLAALIDTRQGGVQAVAGPAALHPKLNVGSTRMYKAFQNQDFSGVWTGPTGIDGVRRVQAFRRVPGRDLVAVVGIDLHDWMAPTETWARHARELAALASLLVAAVGGLVLWWLWTLETNRRLRSALTQARGEGGGVATQLRAALELSAEGAALFGADWRLIAWNPAFATALGLPPVALRRGIDVQDLLRQKAGRPGAAESAAEHAQSETARKPEQAAATAGDTAADTMEAELSGHLVERMAAQLLRSGNAANAAAQLLTPSGGGGPPSVSTPAAGGRPPVSGGNVPDAGPGLAAPHIFAPASVDLVALERAGMVDWSRARSRVAEEFRLVQRQLLMTAFSGSNVQPGFSNLVMVTSSRPGEGKSFTALNLAGSISRQGDHSVLLVDTDSKRDSFSYPLGLADAPGLLDLVADPRLDASTCIVKTPIERLSVLPIGRDRERSPELFSSREMARLIQALGRRYSDRLLILDAPPCLSTSDPAVLASAVGQVLLVVEAERTQRDEVEAAIELIEACPNITLVLNKQRVASRFSFGTYSSYYSS